MKCPHCLQPMPRAKRPDIPEGSAWCRPCDRVRPLTDFHADRGKANGHSSRCIDCTAAKNAAYRRDQAIAQLLATHGR